MGERDWYAPARRRMVEQQLAGRGIRDPRVLEAMGELARHRFVDAALEASAYGDHALPTAERQTISQPYMVARMLELAALEPHHRVLEIGTGSGYQTALLARLAGRVYSIERIASLARAAELRLAACGIGNVLLRRGDGTLGWQEIAPYDRVLVAAAAPRVPDALLEQLGERGVIVIPVGSSQSQQLVLWTRTTSGSWEQRRHGGCCFVPLVGRDAWQEERGKPES